MLRLFETAGAKTEARVTVCGGMGGKATVTRLPWAKLEAISRRIVAIPGVNRCVYDLTPKPPATIEYV